MSSLIKKLTSDIFTKHPHSIGESYTEHFQFASFQGFKLMLGGIACMIHSVFPCVFQTTASTIVKKFNEDIAERTRQKQ